MSASPVRAHALAKINLHLSVHGRQPDGYHDLTTVFQSIALRDTLTLERRDGPFALGCTDPGVPADPTNLVWRAALAASAAWGRSLDGLQVTLEKDVPAQSGLGGGSADAMAMLRALARWWELDVTPASLAELGRPLGADVPFFAWGGTALGVGRGDRLTPLPDLPPHPVVLVRPDFGVGTADAYRWVAESRQTASRAQASGISGLAPWPDTPAGWPERLPQCTNDFEPVVAARHPEISAIVTTMRDAGAELALLSGSGSAVAGVFRDERGLVEGAVRALARKGWTPRVSHTVTAAGYVAASTPVVVPARSPSA